MADIASEPGGFGTPVDVVVGLPDVFASAGEAEGLEAHGFRATLPARIMRSAQEILQPCRCLMGQRRRRALSRRLTLSGQLLRGAKRCWPRPAPATPVAGAVEVPALCQAMRMKERAVVAEVGRPPVPAGRS